MTAVTFLHNSKQLALIFYDNTVQLRDSVTEALSSTLEGHLNVMTAVMFSHDSKQLTSIF